MSNEQKFLARFHRLLSKARRRATPRPPPSLDTLGNSTTSPDRRNFVESRGQAPQPRFSRNQVSRPAAFQEIACVNAKRA